VIDAPSVAHDPPFHDRVTGVDFRPSRGGHFPRPANCATFGFLASRPMKLENRVAMTVRLSLTSMLRQRDSRLVRYQGERRRRTTLSPGAWPESAYQMIARVRQRKPNGTVPSTARRVRFWVSPTPTSCFASRKATSIDQGSAWSSTIQPD
jgi:hypothetical protein